MTNNIIEKASEWLTSTFDLNTQQQVKNLINNDQNELNEAFYKNLEFGTGGMRGIMGVGTNRINQYTLGKNTQGLSNYLHKTFSNTSIKVVIAYDCRNNSKELAQTVANVFSANGIKVYLFSDLRPTPELSFAVRDLNCQCGIVLTASHNPPEYNGYKVYWQDGGQLVPPQDKEIISEIESLNYNEINFNANPSLIEYIDQEVDEAFYQSVISNAKFNIASEHRDNLKIVFTSLHGTSITAVPKVLEKVGYANVHIVEAQSIPNGDFPTVKSPNPEEPEALTMAIDLANQLNADIVIGTDPDADRLGIVVRNNENELVLLNGNQTMVLMTNFLLNHWQKNNLLKGNEFIGTTIVSTPMMFSLADKYKVECKTALTGFKWIAKMIVDYPNQQFVGGGEESFGYMVGDTVRDKDAISSTLLICEIASIAKANGSSVYQELQKLYEEHGYYKEKLISITKKGINGAEEINQMMTQLRENPPALLNEKKVVFVEDYLSSTGINLLTKETEILTLPKSNVIILYLEDGTKICARPSGTEPKIKFYFSANTLIESIDEIPTADQYLSQEIDNIIKELTIED